LKSKKNPNGHLKKSIILKNIDKAQNQLSQQPSASEKSSSTIPTQKSSTAVNQLLQIRPKQLNQQSQIKQQVVV
jgi:translation initiation factor 2B subunit (eIF-2B alpha/beta/delta family)